MHYINETIFFEKNINQSKSKVINSHILINDFVKMISIGNNCTFIDVVLKLGKNSQLIIGDWCKIKGEIIVEEDSTLIIGNQTLFNDKRAVIRCGEKKKIHIGNNCLFANPAIYNTDYHAIYSGSTGLRINHAEDIIIEDNVWLALNSMILKGSIVPKGCIVAAGAIVNKKFNRPNCILAGNPAKVVQENILWSDKINETIPVI